MKLDEFITNVLNDINSGLRNAENITGRGYFVEVSDKRGVQFDIAVTVSDLKSTSAEGSAKAGFIQVLGAGVGAKLENKEENSKVSRIQFTIYVPPKTKDQEQQDIAKMQSYNRNDYNIG